jgi:hypothetical protein
MIAVVAVTSLAVAAVALAWLYFRRFELQRPPLGIFNGADVVLLFVMIVALPFLYLALPSWLVGIIFCGLALNLFYFALEPVLRPRWILWTVALGLVIADVVARVVVGGGSWPSIVVNDVELIVIAATAANMLAQCGMRTRHLGLIAAMLTVYDVLATSRTDLMGRLIVHLAALPYAPLSVWPDGGRFLGLGLGDVLMMALAPLVLRKAYGRRAGLLAAVLGIAVAAGLLAAVRTGVLARAIPVMTLLGPLVLVQIGAWRTHIGRERTTSEYFQAEPAPQRITRERLATAVPVLERR